MIKLFIIRIILFFTWFNSLGFRIRYRLKRMGFINRRVGWTITLFKSFDNPLKKNWKRIKTIGWFSIEQEKLYSNCDVQGLADPFLVTHNNQVFIFFESIVNGKGEIWQAELLDDIVCNIKPIISESFHISYPNVFLHNRCCN